MDKFVTLRNFGNYYQAEIVKGRLESEGIACIISGELTDRIFPAPTPFGGIRLEVNAIDYPKAVELLKNTGYLIEDKDDTPEYLKQIDSVTLKIPFIKKLAIEKRILILSALLLVVTAIIYYFVTLPTLKESLVNGNWCVDRIIYNQQLLQPNSLGLKLMGECNENIDFRENGDIYLPGINTFGASGRWKLNGKEIIISNLDTLTEIYGGDYYINLKNAELILKSKSTTIYSRLRSY